MDTTQINDIEREVLKGLPNESLRIDRSRQNLQIYHGTYTDPETYYYDREGRTRRDLPLMMKVVDTLAGHTYKEPPSRKVTDNPGATEFLELVYKQQRGNNLFAAAEKYVHASDTFAVQVHATGDPTEPVRLHGWTADQLCVWTGPDDQCKPTAVCTIDRYDHQTRYRLWTDAEVRTYATRKWNNETSGGRVPTLISAEPNPYGVIPIVLFHYRLPVTQLCEGGIGDTLAQAQRHINFRLMQNADHLRYSKPVGFLMGVEPTKALPRNPRPGEFERLPATKLDAKGETVKPEFLWVGPPLDWVDKEWDDLKYYWNWMLETCGVPAASIPLDKAVIATVSGKALIARNLPLFLYAKTRQEHYRTYEQALAKVVLTVADRTYGGFPGVDRGFNLDVVFPEPYPDLPPDDKESYLDDLKDRGELSEVQVIMRRFKLSREEAIEHLVQILKDDKEMAAIRAGAVPAEQEADLEEPEDPLDPDEDNN